MPCNNKPTDCAPCDELYEEECPQPRCQDIILPDGSFVNATVVVIDGCITEISSGEAMAYQPDVCCPTGGGGGGGDGLMGPPGPPGTPATITIGTVTSVAPSDPPDVVNSGTPSNAIFNFEIPSGQPGADGTSPTGLTLTVGAWEFETGLVKAVAPDFPPICTLGFSGTDILGLTLVITKDPITGITGITIDGDVFYDFIMGLIAGLAADIAAITGEATWGQINGTLSAQTDLQAQFNVRPRWTYSELAPATPSLGDRWWKISTNEERVWIPPAWIAPL